MASNTNTGAQATATRKAQSLTWLPSDIVAPLSGKQPVDKSL